MIKIDRLLRMKWKSVTQCYISSGSVRKRCLCCQLCEAISKCQRRHPSLCCWRKNSWSQKSYNYSELILSTSFSKYSPGRDEDCGLCNVWIWWQLFQIIDQYSTKTPKKHENFKFYSTLQLIHLQSIRYLNKSSPPPPLLIEL